ncbi:MAG: ABC transporter ATP-binding protein [Pseudomonadales bacterium]|nr:ABC transporter ATP-binding protein [Pseudomonadales bacterium]
MIEISHLVKRFDQLVAVNDLSFRVVPGEILGFLGPNGAGKSTTMKMITGFLSPTEGSVTVNGCDITTDTLAAQQQIGYLPEGAPCYDEMTVRQFLGFIAEIRGYGGDEKQRRIQRVVDTMSLQPVLDQRIETLSKGFTRRVGLAQAIIHDPAVLILDEPTDGLDPNQKHQVREMIRGLSKDKIVIISTHILEEVTAVCTRAVIIAQGKIVADCRPEELEEKSRFHGAVTVTLEESVRASDYVGAFAGIPHVRLVEVNEDANQLTLFPAAGHAALLLAVTEVIRDRQIGVLAIQQEKGRLDEVFRTVTGEVA